MLNLAKGGDCGGWWVCWGKGKPRGDPCTASLLTFSTFHEVALIKKRRENT